MECRGFAVDAEWVTAMVAGWVVGGVGIRYRRGSTLGYGICVPCSKRLPAVRDAFSFGAQKGLLGYATHFQRHSV